MTWLQLVEKLLPALVPVISFVVGWLFPSPLQKRNKKDEEIHNAVGKAESSGGDMSDLDNVLK